jgi:polar amino acid transport system permease protein
MIQTIFATLAQGILVTVILTIGSFVFGAILAVPLVVLRLAPSRTLRLLSGVYIEVARGVPPLVWLLIGFFGVGTVTNVAPLPAALVTLSLTSAAYMAEIYRGAVRGVDQGQWDAYRALGVKNVPAVRRVIVPQTLQICIAPSITYLIGLFKDSALASVIGVQGITFYAALEAQRTLKGIEVFSAAALLYIIVSLPIGLATRWWGSRANIYLAEGRA